MPIDPYTALNAMLRAEAARFTPPVRQAAPVEAAAAEAESEPPQTVGSAAAPGGASAPAPAPADSAA